MPKDRLTTDLDYELGFQVGFLRDTGTEAPSDEDGYGYRTLFRSEQTGDSLLMAVQGSIAVTLHEFISLGSS